MESRRQTEGCTSGGWKDYHQGILDKIQDFCLMDDIFMTVALKNDIKAVECILRIVLQDPQIQVVEVIAQDVMPNLHGRGVRLDVHAIDKNARHFDVEIQRAKDGVSPRRSRHNGAILDMENVPKGGSPQDLPDTYVIFICENDPFGRGLPVYTVDKRIRETGESFDDGMHFVFSNTAYFGDDDFGRLSKDLKEKDPKKMYYAPLANAAAQVKNDRKGVSEMCRIMEEYRDACIREGFEQGVEKGIEKGIAEGMEKGIAEGMEKGIAEGRSKTRMETVHALLKFMEPDAIADRLGYPLDFVREVAGKQQLTLGQ